MTALKTLAIAILVVVGGAIAYAYSGWYDVSVGSGHNALTGWYLETVRERSIERAASDLTVPEDLDSESRVLAGAGHYRDMCAGCHGRPGREPTDRFEPAPPALAQHAEDPAEAFVVIRNGIKMSAMPKHTDHDEAATWDIAAFLQVLPELSASEYETMMAEASHDHGDGEGHSHDDSSSDSGESSEQQSESDHHHDVADEPGAVLDAFHHALAEGNGQQALSWLHENATILEGGHLETRDAYASGHLSSDMAFLANMNRERLDRQATLDDGQARIVTRSRLSGSVEGESVDVISEETATLLRTDDGWRISHLHWRTASAE